MTAWDLGLNLGSKTSKYFSIPFLQGNFKHNFNINILLILGTLVNTLIHGDVRANASSYIICINNLFE